MWLTTALQVILIYQVAHTVNFHWTSSVLRYVDYTVEGADLYFDRVVGLALNISGYHGTNREKIPVALGIWITTDRILASYNPFRAILRNKTLLPHLMTGTLTGRKKWANGGLAYLTNKHLLTCGRQVQVLPDEQITKKKLWHGEDRRNCPLHDLMVFRIDGNETLGTLPKEKHTMAYLWPDGVFSDHSVNIFLADIAKPGDDMGASFKFAHLDGYVVVKVVNYEPDDDGVADCDEWLPREWGLFICIRNKNDMKTMASGAMLVSDYKLFGVGSFVYFRGEQSILVFTDVRYYYENIFNTCTYSDSEETPPTTFVKHS